MKTNFNYIVILGVICRVIGLFISLVTSVFLARKLGPILFGKYAFILTVIELLTILALLGSPALILREVASGLATQEFRRVRGIIRWAARNSLLISIPLMPVALFLLLQGQNSSVEVDTSNIILFLAAILVIPIDAVNRQLTNVIQGTGQVIASQALSLLAGPAVFLISLSILFLVFPAKFTLLNVMLLVVLSRLSGMILTLVGKNHYLPIDVFHSQPEYYPRQWLKSALPLLLVSSFLVINTRIDIVMIGFLKEPGDVGLYRIAQRGGSLLLFAVMAVDSMINPFAAKALATNQKKQLQKAVSKSIPLVFLFMCPFLLVYFFEGINLIRLVYGPEYIGAWLPLVILSIGYFALAFLGRGGVILTMGKFERHTALAIGIGAVSNIVLNLWLIPSYGITGAATATALAVTVRMISEAFFAYSKTGVDTTIMALLKRDN